MLVATLATFLVALATVVSRELLNGRRDAPSPQPRRAPGWVGGNATGAPRAGDDPVDQRRERVAGLLTHGGRLGQITLDLAHPEQTLADLAERIEEPARGRAPMVLVLDGAGEGAATPTDLAELLSQRCRCIIVDLAADRGRREPGFSELLAGEALFSDIITREPGSRLHRIGPGRAGRDAVLAASDLVEVALDALCETYDWVLVAAASNDEASVLASLAGRAQGGLVMAGQLGNGHAVEAAYRLADMTKAPVTLMLDAPETLSMRSLHERDPAPV